MIWPVTGWQQHRPVQVQDPGGHDGIVGSVPGITVVSPIAYSTRVWMWLYFKLEVCFWLMKPRAKCRARAGCDPRGQQDLGRFGHDVVLWFLSSKLRYLLITDTARVCTKRFSAT